MALMGEYLAILEFYGSRTANRSGVPLINHINEGLYLLQQMGASEIVWRAWCIHPIVQDNIDIDVSWSRGFNLACEYRAKVNAYLCAPRNDWIKTVKDLKRVVGSISRNCALMLMADKIQNQKDFRAYHLGIHERSDQLEEYFKLWIVYLTKILHPRKNPAKTVKQVLVRSFNFQQGNLTRLKYSLDRLDPDIKELIQVALEFQANRNIERHQERLQALEENNQAFIEGDDIIQTAIWEVDRNKSVDSA